MISNLKCRCLHLLQLNVIVFILKTFFLIKVQWIYSLEMSSYLNWPMVCPFKNIVRPRLLFHLSITELSFTTYGKSDKQEGMVSSWSCSHWPPPQPQPIFYNNYKWSKIFRNCESLCCTPETLLYATPQHVHRHTHIHTYTHTPH